MPIITTLSAIQYAIYRLSLFFSRKNASFDVTYGRKEIFFFIWKEIFTFSQGSVSDIKQAYRLLNHIIILFSCWFKYNCFHKNSSHSIPFFLSLPSFYSIFVIFAFFFFLFLHKISITLHFISRTYKNLIRRIRWGRRQRKKKERMFLPIISDVCHHIVIFFGSEMCVREWGGKERERWREEKTIKIIFLK